jgi:predicted regulator of Ras-like GTPase activity (Roadblock/LC7/MglB family)
VPADQIEILLAPVLAALPMDLKARLAGTPSPGRTILVPMGTVVNQLAFGVVKIPFGELRRLVPDIFVPAVSEHDQRPVILPLQEILSRINPALLARRPIQQVEVDEAIAGPFGGRGRGVNFTAQPLKPSATATAPRLITPEPAAPPAAPIPFRSASFPGAPEAAVTGASENHAPQASPAFRFTAMPISPVTPPPMSGSPMPASPMISTPPAPTMSWPPAEAQATVPVILGDLAEAWPDEIKREIVQGDFARQPILLAADLIEPGLKRGRVVMFWKDLRTLAKPNSPASSNDGLELELPLKVIVPAFLAARRKPDRPQARVMVSSEIPNLFFGFPQPAAAPAAPAAPAQMPLPSASSSRSGDEPPPRPVVVTSPAFNPVTPKTTDTNFFPATSAGVPEAGTMNAVPAQGTTSQGATDFLKRVVQPKDVVAAALKLPGVAGAVVAVADGLRVAGEVPVGMNADTVAAFLPQIYDRVNQSTRELRMGALNNLNFTVGNVPWKIFRMNSAYFAVFGRAGEPLPTPQLVALAAGLERKQ